MMEQQRAFVLAAADCCAPALMLAKLQPKLLLLLLLLLKKASLRFACWPAIDMIQESSCITGTQSCYRCHNLHVVDLQASNATTHLHRGTVISSSSGAENPAKYVQNPKDLGMKRRNTPCMTAP